MKSKLKRERRKLGQDYEKLSLLLKLELLIFCEENETVEERELKISAVLRIEYNIRPVA